MTAGLERRDEGWSAVQAADVAVHRGYGDYIRAALNGLCQCGDPFTADDVAEVAQQLADAAGHHRYTHSPNLIGAVMGAAARNHRITRTGNRRRSTHPSRNAAYNAEWKAS